MLPTNFCFTINNYTEHQVACLTAMGTNQDRFSYLCWGKEVGASGTPHLQGYGECLKRMKFATGKKLLYNAHIEARMGTAEQAINYCKKDGDFVEFGESRHDFAGKRNDLENMKDRIIKGDSLKAICSDDPGLLRYTNGIKLAFDLFAPTLAKPPVEVRWYWGESGTGKTFNAVNEFGVDKTYIKNTKTKWWDGYDPKIHTCVVLDEYDSKSQKKFFNDGFMKRLMDQYKVDVEIKGSIVQFCPSTLIITSEFPPEHFFTDEENPNRLIQIESRLHNITHFIGDNLRAGKIKTSKTVKDNRKVQCSEVVGNTTPTTSCELSEYLVE